MLGRMNFSGAQTARITKNNSFTVPSDGYIFIRAQSFSGSNTASHSALLKINGVLVCGYVGNDSYMTGQVYGSFNLVPGNMYPVSAGDVCSGDDYSQQFFIDITFVPQKVEA